jgi:uncharacterized protein (DUF983 family)
MGKIVRCERCNAGYLRSTFQAYAREQNSFDCYGCGVELERWNTVTVPTYSIAVAPIAGEMVVVDPQSSKLSRPWYR